MDHIGLARYTRQIRRTVLPKSDERQGVEHLAVAVLSPNGSILQQNGFTLILDTYGTRYESLHRRIGLQGTVQRN